MTLLAELVGTSRTVAETPRRTAKVAALAACLRRIGPDEIEIAVALPSGAPRQGKLGVGLAALAAEWGHGRRTGWLSNLHLGARDPATGQFVMLGKTFKGLTDATLAWQTRELLAREIGRDDWTVHVRPELVVEIAFNELQASPHYPGGLALRFARVKAYRPDKRAEEADTIDTVREIYAAQLARAAA